MSGKTRENAAMETPAGASAARGFKRAGAPQKAAAKGRRERSSAAPGRACLQKKFRERPALACAEPALPGPFSPSGLHPSHQEYTALAGANLAPLFVA